ncbi:Regulator of telomere elongation helicase 1-like protein [Hypsibius exemplaris]|uniref:Regulator of telomere elongation helicase 1 homolog n=1 Tax=Hypsibius exemplaris TaxID=2072580 RepID=A0A1W0X2V5_HYPEX|nr:Regulator of telomere elongation helicase 1-like protein [Hypsibius exemplaris]
MVLVTVRGIAIEFPYEPYAIQVNYMEKVIEALQTKSNALLESPTGTGKTLCLLCASMAWLEHHKKLYPPSVFSSNQTHGEFGVGGEDRRRKRMENVRSTETPRIIYASRTHSQLAQVMQELKKTPYKRTKVSIMGSRDQMCLNTDVSRLPSNAAKNGACREKVKARSCHYYNNLDEKMDSLSLEPVADIEELVGFGKRNRVCPYYLAKAGEKQADLIFMPYNYIFDPAVRRTVKLDLMNAVVILDEGHNVGKVCEESYSHEITSVDLAVCIREIGRILTYMAKREKETTGKTVDVHQATSQPMRDLNTDSLDAPATIGDVAELKRALLDFEKAFDSITVSENADLNVRSLTFLAELFNAAGITQQRFGMLYVTMENLTKETAEKEERGSVISGVVAPVQKFMELLCMAFAEETKKYHNFFRVYIRNEDVKKRAREGWNTDAVTTKLSRILSVWCLSPGCTMKTIASSGIHSMLITSGTLAPMEPLLKELMIPFTIQLSNPHIIKSSQVWMGIIGKGPDNIQWSSGYENRDNISYRRSLGRGILNLLDSIPDGVLVFFSSYWTMQSSIETWTAEGIWDGMNKKKTCFVEPTNRNDFTAALADYFRIVKQKENGAAFFGVCRGKISEGVDFPDCCARAVIVTGVPFPAAKEPRVLVKRKYLDQSYQQVETRTLTSHDWYNREAFSAVNQALGRVIRHAQDFGACILCDYRFEMEGNRRMLSGWLRNVARSYTFALGKRSMAEFFAGHTGIVRSAPQDVSDMGMSGSARPASRPKRELSADGSSSSCKSACGSRSQCMPEPVFDNAALSVYCSLPVTSVAQPLTAEGGKRISVFDALNAQVSSTSLPSVNLSTEPKAPRFPVSLSTIPDIPSSFPSSHPRKHRVIPRPFDLDTKEVTSSGESRVPGVPTGFVKVIPRPMTTVLGVTQPTVRSTLPSTCCPTAKPKLSVPETIAIIRNDLNAADFKHLSGILSELRKPATEGCLALTVALANLDDKVKRNKVALLLSSFIPKKFRGDREFEYLDRCLCALTWRHSAFPHSERLLKSTKLSCGPTSSPARRVTRWLACLKCPIRLTISPRHRPAESTRMISLMLPSNGLECKLLHRNLSSSIPHTTTIKTHKRPNIGSNLTNRFSSTIPNLNIVYLYLFPRLHMDNKISHSTASRIKCSSRILKSQFPEQPPPPRHSGLLPTPQNDFNYGRPPEGNHFHPPEQHFEAPRPPWQQPPHPQQGPAGPQQHYQPPQQQQQQLMETVPLEHPPAPYYQYTLAGNLEYVDPSGSGVDPQYAGFDFEGYYAQQQSAEALKKLPPWIREGLEKLEREKQKEREKQRFMQQYETRMKEESSGAADKTGRSRFSSSPSRSRSVSAEKDKSESDEEFDADVIPMTEEEKQVVMLKAMKEMVTAVLMASTTRVLEKACLEEIEARKVVLKQAAVQPVRMSAALASLAQFGSSDSDSDEERLPPPPPGVLKSLSTAQKLSDKQAPLPGIASRGSSSEKSPSPRPKAQREKSPPVTAKANAKPEDRDGSPVVRRNNGSASPSRTKSGHRNSSSPKRTSSARKHSNRRSPSSSSDSDSHRGRRKRVSPLQRTDSVSSRSSARKPRSPSPLPRDRTASVAKSLSKPDDRKRGRRRSSSVEDHISSSRRSRKSPSPRPRTTSSSKMSSSSVKDQNPRVRDSSMEDGQVHSQGSQSPPKRRSSPASSDRADKDSSDRKVSRPDGKGKDSAMEERSRRTEKEKDRLKRKDKHDSSPVEEERSSRKQRENERKKTRADDNGSRDRRDSAGSREHRQSASQPAGDAIRGFAPPAAGTPMPHHSDSSPMIPSFSYFLYPM